MGTPKRKLCNEPFSSNQSKLFQTIKYFVKIYANFQSNRKFSVYILRKNLNQTDINQIIANLNLDLLQIHPIQSQNSEIDYFLVYGKRYAIEIYFRIFVSKYLFNNLHKILYLDTDIVVINKLKELYETDLENNYFIATTHI